MNLKTTSSLHVAVVQQRSYEDIQHSWRDTVAGLEQAAQQGAELVLLQELHAGPYFCQSEDSKFFERAESIPGPTTELLSACAKRLNLVIVGSIFEKRAPGLYHNTAVVFEKTGEIAGIYRKMHIPDDPQYYEKYYFTPGDLGFQPIATSVGKLGVLVCWDQWYPEAARIMALKGAEILLYPTAIGWFPEDPAPERAALVDSWMTIQRSHSIANGLPVLACNRIGFEKDTSGVQPGLEFWGNSFICAPHGKVLAHASADKPEVLIAQLDLSDIEKTRQTWPYLRDRRIDAYGDILKRYAD